VRGRTGHQVSYLAELASRVAPGRPPRSTAPMRLPEPLQPPRPLFAGAVYRLDGALDPGPGLFGQDATPDAVTGSAAGAGTADAGDVRSGPSGRDVLPRAGIAAPGSPVLPAPIQPALAETAAGKTASGKPAPTERAGVLRAAPAGPGPDTAGFPVPRPTGRGPAAQDPMSAAPSGPGLKAAPSGAGSPAPGASLAGTVRLGAGDMTPEQAITAGAGGRGAGSGGPAAPRAVPRPSAGRTPTTPRPEEPGRGPAAQPGRGPAAQPGPDWLRGTPVDLAEPPSPTRTGMLPPRGSREQRPADGLEPGGTRSAADHPGDRGNRSGAVRDLVPPAADGRRLGEQAGVTRSARSAGETPARVTIGTIEVTVVPPAQPAHGASEPARVPPLPPAVKRPTSLLGESGSARLRNGLRRWYGIAQG
jgi:hypothetical protein